MKTPISTRGDEARKAVRQSVRKLVRAVGDGAAAEFLREEAGRVEKLGEANAKLVGLMDSPHVKSMQKRRQLFQDPGKDLEGDY